MTTHDFSNQGLIIVVGDTELNLQNGLIEFRREQDICSGINRATLTVTSELITIPEIYSKIYVYEGDYEGETFVGETFIFYVASIERFQGSTVSITCQDITKLLADYLVEDDYTIEEPTTTRYWIEKFLDEAGIDYYITESGYGAVVSNNASFGREPLIDTLTFLVQHSGWYFIGETYNDGGTLKDRIKIGKLLVEDDDYKAVPENLVESCNTSLTDKNSRNRVVIWGASNAVTKNSVFADISVMTGWQVDSTDVRTALMANPNISDNTSATSIATKLLNEMQRLTYTKEIVLDDVCAYDESGNVTNYELGDLVTIIETSESQYSDAKLNGISGVITSIQTEISIQGRKKTIILDQRCPRMIGFYDYGGYVYIGTVSGGIWRKHLKYIHTWEDYSQGLPTKATVLDLHVSQGVLASIIYSGGLYLRSTADAAWTKFTPPPLTSAAIDGVSEMTFTDDQLYPRCCTVDKYTGHIYAGYYAQPSGLEFRSWIVDIAPNKQLVNSYQIIDQFGLDNYRVNDLDTMDSGIAVSAGNLAVIEDDLWPIEEWSQLSILSRNIYNHNYRKVSPYGTVKYGNPTDPTFITSLVSSPNALACFCHSSSGRFNYWANSGSVEVVDLKYAPSDPRNVGGSFPITGILVGVVGPDIYSIDVAGTKYAWYCYNMIFGMNWKISDDMYFTENVTFKFGTVTHERAYDSGMVKQTITHLITLFKGVSGYTHTAQMAYAYRGFGERVFHYASSSTPIDSEAGAIQEIIVNGGKLGWAIVHYEGHAEPEWYGYFCTSSSAGAATTTDITQSIRDYVSQSYPEYNLYNINYVKKQVWPIGGKLVVPFKITMEHKYTYKRETLTGFLDSSGAVDDSESLSTLRDNELHYFQAYSVGGYGGDGQFLAPPTESPSPPAVRYPAFFGDSCIVVWVQNTLTNQITDAIVYPGGERHSAESLTGGYVPWAQYCIRLAGNSTIIGVDGENLYFLGLGGSSVAKAHGQDFSGSTLLISHDLCHIDVIQRTINQNRHYIFAPQEAIDDPDFYHRLYLEEDTKLLLVESEKFTRTVSIPTGSKIEISKGYPIAIYGNTITPTRIPTASGTESGVGWVYLTPDGSLNTINRMLPENYMLGTDARTFSALLPVGENPEGTYTNWVMFPQFAREDPHEGSTDLVLFDSNFMVLDGHSHSNIWEGTAASGVIMGGIYTNMPYSGVYYLKSFPGFIRNIETSNYEAYPYMFASSASNPPLFYQKDSNTTGLLDTDFALRIDGIPSAYITIIRVDDRI